MKPNWQGQSEKKKYIGQSYLLTYRQKILKKSLQTPDGFISEITPILHKLF